jgi:hypothetical protein
MLKEVSDHFEVLTWVHNSIDKIVEGLTQEQWLLRPNWTFNNIASIIKIFTR